MSGHPDDRSYRRRLRWSRLATGAHRGWFWAGLIAVLVAGGGAAVADHEHVGGVCVSAAGARVAAHDCRAGVPGDAWLAPTPAPYVGGGSGGFPARGLGGMSAGSGSGGGE